MCLCASDCFLVCVCVCVCMFFSVCVCMCFQYVRMCVSVCISGVCINMQVFFVCVLAYMPVRYCLNKPTAELQWEQTESVRATGGHGLCLQ